MKKLFGILFVLIPSVLFSQGEFRINTFLNSDQRDPQVVTENNGNYLVVWTSLNQSVADSKEDIFFQYLDGNLNKTGNEIRVNDYTEGEQIYPSAAMNENNAVIITWASFSGFEDMFNIKAKLYRNGNPAGDEFLVNTYTVNAQTRPSVDIMDDGSFIIVWESWYEDGSDRGIFGQRYHPDGTKNGEQFRVNLTTQNSQARPVVKYFSDGKAVVLWESWRQDNPAGADYGVFGRIINSSGQLQQNEIQINNYTTDYQWYADVITLDDNNFIAAWCSWEQDGSDGGIYINKFNTAGEPLGTEVQVNSTGRYYQWLPELALTKGGDIVVVWSSWQQDGSREGVYAKILDSSLNEKSFEIRINEATESFQWEPDVTAISNDELFVVWSDYNTTDKNYDITGKRSSIIIKEGTIEKSGFSHTAGLSTAGFLVSVIDTGEVTGDTYELTFTKDDADQLYASIKNLNSSTVVVPEFYLNQGEDVYYLTPVFDGVAVEIKPVLTLEVDFNKSFFNNTSGTNINFSLLKPAGTTVVAPIDAVIIWGDASKNQDGKYIAPLDSAYSSAGKMEIKIPFIAWDISNNKKLDCYIIEPAATKNLMWEPGENIIILTPPEYQNTFPNFHVQLNTKAPEADIIYPGPGDTTFIYTRRPITVDDIYSFSTEAQYIVTGIYENELNPSGYSLKQNYPNPFNPTTTISFSLPEDGFIKLKIFNALGEHITTLKEEFMLKGNYRIIFNTGKKELASGVYFYSLEAGNKQLTRKMLLLK